MLGVIQLDYLKELLSLLKASGCEHFKMEGLELSFGVLETLPTEVHVPPLATETLNLDQPDLKADDLFDHDKILHWSGSGDQDPMPLTGEDRLVAP